MYENQTFNIILQRALEKVPSNVDKRQGAIIYDALAPVCAELAQAYIDLDIALKEGFADTSSREYLIKRALERGLTPYTATYSIVLAELVGNNLNLSGGERFSSDEVNFYYTGEKEEEYYKLKCETSGEIGNVSFGELIPISNIPNLQKASIVNLFTSAREEEDTEAFRKRYLDSFESQAFGGNRADYIQKLNSLNDLEGIQNNGAIGGIKLYRTPTGIATVDIYIQNGGYGLPTQALIDIVQREVDPLEYTGEGYGIAPIGHFVTIKPIEEKEVNIQTIVELKSGYVLDDVKTYIDNAIEDYFQELRQSWQNEDNLYIRIARLEAIILNVNGIVDIRDTTINGAFENLILNENTIPIRGVIDVIS